MSTWQLVRELFFGARIGWRKLSIVAILMVATWGTYAWWQNQEQPMAAIKFAQMPQYSSVYQSNVNISVSKNGKVLIDGRNASKSLKILPQYYELLILAFDSPGIFIQNFRAEVHLPQEVDSNQIDQNIIAVHGVETYRTYMLDRKTLVYEAQNISPQATLTLVAHLPKSMLNPPLNEKIAFYFTQLPIKIHLWLAIILPLLTLFTVFYMVLQRRKSQFLDANIAPVEQPPHQFAPAIVGVLFDGWIGARGIASTLIDLANRGYILIIRKGENFAFGKRKSLQVEFSSELRPFERILLSKIFEPQNYKSTREDVEVRVGHHIFSRKVAEAYLAVYDEATQLGFFVKNPAGVQRKWKYIGIMLFFLGGLGYILTAWFAPDPKFTLFFWAGEMLAASEIIKFSPMMPVRSTLGDQEIKKWLAFRRFLTLPKPIEGNANTMGLYLQYLPYAIILGVEAEWTRRFLNEPFTKPDWYDSNEAVVTMESYVAGLLPIISFVGGTLDKSHEPTVG